MSVVASAILCRIHAVSVSDSSDYFYNHIDNTLQQMGLLKDNGNPLRATDILEVVDGYKGRGYGLSTAEELSECSSMCPTHLACNGVMYIMHGLGLAHLSQVMAVIPRGALPQVSYAHSGFTDVEGTE